MGSPKYVPAYCPKCKDQVMGIGSRPSHVMHLILSVITGGVWLIVWAFFALRRGSLKCVKCGGDL